MRNNKHMHTHRHIHHKPIRDGTKEMVYRERAEIFRYRHYFKEKVKVAQSCLTWTVQSMEFSRPEYWSGQPFPYPGNLLNPGIEPRLPTLQADFLPACHPGKPKNTRIGSLSLLQQIFPTQESNRGLLHCRQILYQLSYQGSP